MSKDTDKPFNEYNDDQDFKNITNKQHKKGSIIDQTHYLVLLKTQSPLNHIITIPFCTMIKKKQSVPCMQRKKKKNILKKKHNQPIIHFLKWVFLQPKK